MIADRILEKYKVAHDAHLDTAAQAMRYDSIHTAALRAGFAGPFQAEGIAFAQWMDACNATGYEVMAEIIAGTRPALAVNEYIGLLPILVLP